MMIDSSGRRALRANGTVLDLLPVGQAIGVTGFMLVILFTLVRPEASIGLGTLGRLFFWTAHVGLGLVSLWFASQWLGSGQLLPQSPFLRVVMTGVAGIIVAAPGYIVLDVLFAPYQQEQSPDVAASSLLALIGNEVVEIAPWFMASWLLINLPVLLPRPTLSTPTDESVSHAPRILEEEGEPKSTVSNDVDNETRFVADRFLSSLPGVIGKDVIAVSSDLHYLNVWTVAGRTTVLGNLRDVVAELDDIGMQVHRSHWIAHAHVRRIVGTASSGACILSNELRIPISRRRWKDVREQFGRGFVENGPG